MVKDVQPSVKSLLARGQGKYVTPRLDEGESLVGRGGWDRMVSPALLVLDMQIFFLNHESHAFVPSALDILGRIRLLSQDFLDHGLPVIYTRHGTVPGMEGVMGKWWRDVLYRGEDRWNIHCDVFPRAKGSEQGGKRGDVVVVDKDTYSAFVNTSLEEILRERDVVDVVLTGVMTHLCVETTARHAFTLGFRPWTVVDCVADRDERMHVSSLRAMADGFSMVITSAEVIKMIDDWRRMYERE